MCTEDTRQAASGGMIARALQDRNRDGKQGNLAMALAQWPATRVGPFRLAACSNLVAGALCVVSLDVVRICVDRLRACTKSPMMGEKRFE